MAMEALVERCAGLDVHQASVVCCVLVGPPGCKTRKLLRTFGTKAHELGKLRAWLAEARGTPVCMETTGIYWKPVYAALEGHFDLTVGNAHHMAPSSWGHRRGCSKSSANGCCICPLPTTAVWQLGFATTSAFSRRWRAVSCRDGRLRNYLTYWPFSLSVQFRAPSAMTPGWMAAAETRTPDATKPLRGGRRPWMASGGRGRVGPNRRCRAEPVQHRQLQADGLRRGSPSTAQC